MMNISIATLITCFNRREKTIACLQALFGQKLNESWQLIVYVVDAGSTDGTAEAIRRRFPQVKLLCRDDSLYWCGAMRVAFEHAMKKSFNYYLWLNDDTHLYPEALSLLLATMEEVRELGHTKSIIIGATQDVRTMKLSYSGWVSLSKLNPADCIKVPPSDHPIECDSINGNCVLIPWDVAELVGNLDPIFTHSMGDMDYGFRACESGCKIWLAPGFSGTCEKNIGKGLWTDTSLPLRERWRRLLGPKGLPPEEWLVYTRRHSGALWPLYWVNPYVKFWFRSLLMRNGKGHR